MQMNKFPPKNRKQYHQIKSFQINIIFQHILVSYCTKYMLLMIKICLTTGKKYISSICFILHKKKFCSYTLFTKYIDLQMLFKATPHTKHSCINKAIIYVLKIYLFKCIVRKYCYNNKVICTCLK